MLKRFKFQNFKFTEDEMRVIRKWQMKELQEYILQELDYLNENIEKAIAYGPNDSRSQYFTNALIWDEWKDEFKIHKKSPLEVIVNIRKKTAKWRYKEWYGSITKELLDNIMKFREMFKQK
jgi:hypothetical protein